MTTMTSGGNSAFPSYNTIFAHIEDLNERRPLALAQIDNAPFGWRHARAVVVAGVGFFTGSYDIFAINLCSAMLGVVYWQDAASRPGKIPYNSDTAIKVSTSGGTVIGQPFFGWLADIVGRKRMYGNELIIIILATLAQALASNSPAVSITGILVFWRVLMGIDIGGDYPLSSIITSDIAQQCQTASRAILLHPLTLTLLSLILALLSQHFYKTTSDWILLLTITTGCIATVLSFTRYITSGYLDEAERVGTWRWLYSNYHHNSNPPQNQIPASNDARTIDMDKDGDLILITKFGDRIIGTLVLRVVDTVSELDEHVFAPQEILRIGVLGNGIKIGVIRAWTVQLQYRGVGVGRSLLEAAVEVSRKRGWRGPVFSVGHANSKRFGLRVGSMEIERYEWAWELLEDVRGEFGIVGG